MNYYRRYIGDFQRDTGNLSLIEVGAYDRLLDHYYATEKPLPITLEELYRISRAISDEEKDAVRVILDRFFPISQGSKRRNPRADREINIALSARENGEKGGRPRKTEPRTGSITEMVTGDITGNETKAVTETITETGHPPASNHQPPTTSLQPPTTSLQPEDQKQGQKRRAAPSAAAPPGKTVELWKSYSDAYFARYGTEPVRNARVNGQLAKVVDRIGIAESPGVAAFYVRSNRGFYVARKHPVGTLLADCESLRTEWATGQQGTDAAARQTDRISATGAIFEKLIAEARSEAKPPLDPDEDDPPAGAAPLALPLNGSRWFLSPSGILAKAREFGIPEPGTKAAWPAFEKSILERAGITAEMIQTARAEA